MRASAVSTSPDLRQQASSDFSAIDLQWTDSHASDEAHPAVGNDSIKLLEPLVSKWSRSGWKRLSDCIFVSLSLPLFTPLLLIIGLAVRLTSSGPVLFLQERSGMGGKKFTILKFRTMEHLVYGVHNSVTTESNQRFTSIGPLLRRWKLDELPQLFNVLAGHMSLVGPRPKLPQHQLGVLLTRPGITGAATLLFAREEHVFACVSVKSIDDFYYSVVLPAKHQLDRQYAAHATFTSDLKLIISTVLRRWDSSTICELFQIDISALEGDTPRRKAGAFKVSPALSFRSVSNKSRAEAD